MKSVDIIKGKGAGKLKIEKIPDYRIAYVRQVGPYGPENKEAMEQIKKWAMEKDLMNDTVIFGIPQDHPAVTRPEHCRYDACIVIPHDIRLEEGVSEGELIGGEYLIYKVKHTAEDIQEAWAKVFEGLQDSGYELDHKPIMERYSNEMISNHFCELCVPVKRKEGSLI